MIGKLLALVCLLACSLVSAQQNVEPVKTTESKETAALNVSMSMSEPCYHAEKMQIIPAPVEMQQQQQQNVNETEKRVVSNIKQMRVTGLITASGSIFELDDDKKSVGVIESREYSQILTPQPGEFICNYGSVVVYSDRPCEDVMSMKKEKKQKPNKSVKTETDKETDQKQTTVANDQTQADENTDMETENTNTKDEDMKVDENKPMTQKNKNKKKVKKTKKKKSKKNKGRKQNGVKYIRVRTKIRRPLTPEEKEKILRKQQQRQQQQQQQQGRPVKRPQNNRRRRRKPTPSPRPTQEAQLEQSKRDLPNRRRGPSALYTTSGGKIYELSEIVH